MQPNGGNAEVFQINLPSDRIMAGGSKLQDPTPPTLAWPDVAPLADTEIELFKVRNSNNRVIGVASRVAVSDAQSPQAVEWMLYLPARGSMYVPMTVAPAPDAGRVGALRTGTREFSNRRGNVSERYLPKAGADDDEMQGQIELRATLVSLDTGDTGGEAP